MRFSNEAKMSIMARKVHEMAVLIIRIANKKASYSTIKSKVGGSCEFNP